MIHSALKVFNIVREKVEDVMGVIQFQLLTITQEETNEPPCIEEVRDLADYEAAMAERARGMRTRVAPEIVIYIAMQGLDKTEPGFHGLTIRLLPIFAKMPESDSEANQLSRMAMIHREPTYQRGEPATEPQRTRRGIEQPHRHLASIGRGQTLAPQASRHSYGLYDQLGVVSLGGPKAGFVQYEDDEFVVTTRRANVPAGKKLL